MALYNCYPDVAPDDLQNGPENLPDSPKSQFSEEISKNRQKSRFFDDFWPKSRPDLDFDPPDPNLAPDDPS